MYKINSNTMKHLSLHWLWGLKYSKKPMLDGIVLAEELELLASDKPAEKRRLANMINKQDSIRESNIATRLFHWVFNVDNYRSDYYKLAICHAWRNQLHHSPQTAYAEAPQGSSILVSLRNLASWISQSLRFEFSPERYARPVIKNSDELRITPRIADQLEILGVEANVGDAISISQFRPELASAYRTRILEAHPDKGGSPEEFAAVNEAYSELRELVVTDRHAAAPRSSTRSISDLLSPTHSHEYFYKKFEKLITPLRNLAETINDNEIVNMLNWLDAHVFSMRSTTNEERREIKFAEIRGKIAALSIELIASFGYSRDEMNDVIGPMRDVIKDYGSFITDQNAVAHGTEVSAINGERTKKESVVIEVLEGEFDTLSIDSNSDTEEEPVEHAADDIAPPPFSSVIEEIGLDAAYSRLLLEKLRICSDFNNIYLRNDTDVSEAIKHLSSHIVGLRDKNDHADRRAAWEMLEQAANDLEAVVMYKLKDTKNPETVSQAKQIIACLHEDIEEYRDEDPSFHVNNSLGA